MPLRYDIMVSMITYLTVDESEKKFWSSFLQGVHLDRVYRSSLKRRNSGKARHCAQNYNQRLKSEVLTHYGGGELACVKCGFSDIKALSLDHISGNGAAERKKLGYRAQEVYLTLRKLNWPVGYQTLCMNCQWIKRSDNGEVRGKTKYG